MYETGTRKQPFVIDISKTVQIVYYHDKNMWCGNLVEDGQTVSAITCVNREEIFK